MSEKTDVYNIYYDTENLYVVMDWDGYATSKQFREGTELMLKILTENKATKVLADAKDMVLIGMEDQKWIENYFLPIAVNHGFKAIALVKPTSYFNLVALESVSYKIGKEKKLLLQMFDNLEEAKNWLKELPF